jgi:hypothetical protein
MKISPVVGTLVNSAPLGVEPITKLFAGVENMTDDGVKKPDTRLPESTGVPGTPHSVSEDRPEIDSFRTKT